MKLLTKWKENFNYHEYGINNERVIMASKEFRPGLRVYV